MPVILSREESIGIVIIDNAQQLNAMNLRAFDQVDEILQVVGSDKSIRALIITAVGTRAFCVGADLSDLSGIGPEEAFTRAARRRGILQKLAELEVPSIAAMDGLVMGGGV